MSLNFPNSPAVGQVFIAQGVSFTWTGTVWVQTGGASGSDGMPVGAVMFFAASSVPPGWLVCDNQVVTAIYPDLRQYLLDAGSPYGELNGDPRVPDLRGEFIRGFDDGRGVDPARVFGSGQMDQNRSHVHGALGGGSIARLTPGGTGGTFGFAAGASGIGANSTASEGGDEARPRNVALLPCIKAFAATVVEGIANFALATPEQARAGTSPDTLMSPALVRGAYREQILTVTDGILTDLGTTFQQRLVLPFTAAHERTQMFCQVGCGQTGTASANDILAELRLRDMVAGQDVASSLGGETIAGALGFGARFTLGLTYAALTIGRAYEYQLWMRKTQNTGPTLPRDLRMDGRVFL